MGNRNRCSPISLAPRGGCLGIANAAAGSLESSWSRWAATESQQTIVYSEKRTMEIKEACRPGDQQWSVSEQRAFPPDILTAHPATLFKAPRADARETEPGAGIRGQPSLYEPLSLFMVNSYSKTFSKISLRPVPGVCGCVSMRSGVK